METRRSVWCCCWNWYWCTSRQVQLWMLTDISGLRQSNYLVVAMRMNEQTGAKLSHNILNWLTTTGWKQQWQSSRRFPLHSSSARCYEISACILIDVSIISRYLCASMYYSMYYSFSQAIFVSLDCLDLNEANERNTLPYQRTWTTSDGKVKCIPYLPYFDKVGQWSLYVCEFTGLHSSLNKIESWLLNP